MRQGVVADLDGWIDDALRSPIGRFGRGVAADKEAIAAAIEEPWSNGQTGGQITKLKLVKQQMYGRAHLDLLRACLLGADWARCTEIASEPLLNAILQSGLEGGSRRRTAVTPMIG